MQAPTTHSRPAASRPSEPEAARLEAPARPVLGARLVVLAGLLAGSLASVGCNSRTSVPVPNRVLDRPTDMVLTCVRRDELTNKLSPTSLELCQEATCNDLRLVGFVANSERDEVAMFSKCANAVLDMDPATPGAQLIPSGKVPSSMTVTTGAITGCFALSANLGSCDLSLYDVPGLAAYAFDEVLARDPSELITTITPTRGDNTPLGARPGQVLAVPPELSNSVLFGDLEGDTDTGGDSGDSGDSETGGTEISVCDPERPGSVYVTFPSCQLVAEIDLRTQRILQSRQFFRDPDTGEIGVKDTGVDPECPIDCPELYADDPGALADAPPGEVDGMYPSAMALVTPIADPVDAADEEIIDNSLYVGGLGSDSLVELRYDGRRWSPQPLQLELQDASGISVIRPTPPMELTINPNEPFHQFLYIVAGDGSTRVVRREFDENRTTVGRECDTQVDPTAVLDLVCHPAEFPGENPPDRRPFARGPGIRGPNGSLITDWTFQKLIASPDSVAESQAPSSPFGKPGVTGVGTTSFGRVVFATFEQFNTDSEGKKSASRVSPTVDPLGLLDATIQPHMLWPQLDPRPASVEPEGLPRMDDAEPTRLLPGNEEGADAIKVLSPALRRIDLAYAELGFACTYVDDKAEDGLADDKACQTDTKDKNAFCASDNRCRVEGSALLSPRILANEGDRLGNPDAAEVGGSGLYTEEVVRAVVRDYRSWISSTGAGWTLFWEGEIPGTLSATGQFVCARPGWEGGTCLATEPGDARVIDQTARFCDAGVLAGDKLQLFGCSADADCGVGQYCLVDPRRTTSGICVSQAAHASEGYLLQVCEDLLYDPCGPPVREFLITDAFQSELWLQAMDRPLTSYLMYTDATEAEGPPPTVPQRELCDGTYRRTLPDDSAEPSQFPNECEARLVCAPEQPDTGCETHADCIALIEDGSQPNEIFPLCVDGLCRRVCTGEKDPMTGEFDDCVLRRLPGPTCVRELSRYLVLARNSFVVRGPGSYDFLDQRVRVAEDGSCYEDPEVSNLLTSRIRLGADEADTRNNSAWPIPTCPPGSERPGAGTPNPCFIDTPRPANLPPDAQSGLFHNFSYGFGKDADNTVPALRFSNPMMSFVLDLTSLDGLIDPIPGTEMPWSPDFAEFRRSRIPRNFNESFNTRAGYSPFDVPVVATSLALVGPTRIINAPELGYVYIVDSAGGTGTGGVRGQVIRIGLAGGQSNPDVKFLVH